MAAWVNGHPEHFLFFFCSLHRDWGAAQSTPEAVHPLTNRLLWHRAPSAWARHGGRDTLTFSLEILFCFPFVIPSIHVVQPEQACCTHIHFISTLPLLCCVNQTCKKKKHTKKKKLHDKFIYRKNSLLFHLSLVLLCATMFQATGLGAAFVWNQMKGEAAHDSEKGGKKNNTANADPYSHTRAKITFLIIQLRAEGCTVSLQPLRTRHRVFQCVFTNTEPSDERECRSTHGWESPHWMHEWLITFLPVWTTLSKKKRLSCSLKRPN